MAINFTDPLARTDDAVAQPNRSSTEDQRRELGEAIKELKRRTGAARVRWSAIRAAAIRFAAISRTAAAPMSAMPCCAACPTTASMIGMMVLGNEFNGRGPFLRGLNEGDSEVTAGTAFLTLRSDGNDKFAASRRPLRRQAGRADRHHRGWPGAEGRHQSRARRDRPSRDGVSSARVPRDLQIHRRPRAGPDRDYAGSGQVRLSGLVTGTPGGVQTNRPVAGASVDVHRVSPDTGERLGGPIHSSQTGADGRWGPAQVDPSWYLEIVLTSPGSTTTHFYRSPFPRSSDIVHLRAARPLGPADAGAGAVVMMSRPRGYFGLPRDVVLLDGKEPADVEAGRADRFGQRPCGFRPRKPGAPSPRSSTRSGSSPGPGRRRKTGLRSPS